MGRVLSFILAVFLVLSLSVPALAATSVSEKDIMLELSYGTRSGKYTGDVNDAGLPDGSGSFSSYNSAGEPWTYEGEWTNGHMDGTGVTTWSEMAYSGTYVNDIEHGEGTETFSDGSSFEGLFWDDSYAIGTYYNADGTSFFAALIDGYFYYMDRLAANLNTIYGDNDASSPSPSPVPTETPSADNHNYLSSREPLEGAWPTDFFTDAARQEKFTELRESYQYDELIAYVREYIGAGVSKEDYANDILATLEPLEGNSDKWIVDFDDFDGTYSLTFPGANSISQDISVCVSVDKGSSKITVGFQRGDWLFFDHIYLSIDGEVVDSGYYKSYNIERNVLGGGLVEEKCNYSIDGEILDKLKDAERVVIRFENGDNDETFDHVLTQEEIGAILMANTIYRTDIRLRNYLSGFNSPKSIEKRAELAEEAPG